MTALDGHNGFQKPAKTVKPATERIITRHLAAAGQESVWAEMAAKIYSRGVGRILSAWGIDPNSFLLNNLRFGRMEKGLSGSDAGKAASPLTAFFQPVYHGSPHSGINRFSLDKIGTGQGAQSFGWGLYFAGSKQVAEFYRKSLAHVHHDEEFYVNGERVGVDNYALRDLLRTAKEDGLDAARENARYYAGEYEARIARFKAGGSDFEPLDDIRRRDYYLTAWRVLTDIISLDEIEIRRDEGQLYAVDIPDDDVLLDWDKSLSGQPEAVREAINDYLKSGVSVREVSGSQGLYELLHNGSILRMFTGDDIAEAANNPVNYYGRGQDFYSDLSRKLGSAQAASEYLNSVGIKGLKYLDGDSRDSGTGSHNYVIFDDAAIKIMEQGLASDIRCRTEFLDDGNINIIFGPNADASTAIHEAAHMFRELMRRAVESSPEQIVDQAAFRRLREDWHAVENWLSVLDDEAALKNEYDRWGLAGHFVGRAFESLNSKEKAQARDVAKHERFARGFETYLMEGQAPTRGLRGIFQRMKGWLLDIYASAKELDAPLTPEVREVFDRLLASDQELAAEKLRDATMNGNMAPVAGFKRPGQRANIDPNQYSFDFELAAALADRLEVEIHEEDVQHDERPEITVQSRQPGLETGNRPFDQQVPHGQLFGDGHTGTLGHEPAGRTESPGTKPAPASVPAPGAAGDGTEYSRPAGEFRANGRGPDQARDSDRPRSEYESVNPPAPQPANYVITDADRLGQGGAKTKFRDNIAALKTLKRLQSAGAALAPPEDRQALVRYVGWGGLPQAFDLHNENWKSEAEELRALLTVEEYSAARRSTQDAHYTSREVVQGIYQGLERLGFRGSARILEPSAGIGHFCGLMPEAPRNEANHLIAIELDPLSAAIGQYLYPKAHFINKGFQDILMPANSVDLAIGNPPFGNQQIYDPHYPGANFSIHNFFLAKSISSLRDGGVAAFVVSRYFLDAQNSQAREYIAERANFLGAIRLPNTAFKQNALTEVTADLVFFQRTNEPELEPSWLKTGTVLDPDGNEITVNQYFIDNPGQMIGRMVKTENMFKGSADLLPPDDFVGFSIEIANRLSALPENIYSPRTDLLIEAGPDKEDPNLAICSGLKVGTCFLTSRGQLARRGLDLYDTPQYEIFEPKNKRAGERIAGLIPIRDCLTELMALEQQEGINESELSRLRQNLNRLYDGFIQKNGYLNSLGNRQAMRDDPQWPLISSLEREYDPGISPDTAKKTGQAARASFAVKADIFKQRVLGPRARISKVDTPKEALIVSMNEYGRPDLEFMENLCGRPADEIADDLAGLIYQNPANQEWELADHYLTGNVKAKLIQAEQAARADLRFKANVEALRMVQPPDLEPVDISVQLGSTWVPPEVVAEFGNHLLGEEAVKSAGYHPALAGWVMEFNVWQVDRTANENTWGTSRYPAHKLIDSILNNTLIQVRDEVGREPQTNKPIYKLNEDETAAANQKADEIKQAFVDWIWREQNRREKLACIYNDRFNTNIPRKYDGSHLQLPGSSLNITLRPHQKDAIWRGIQDGTTIWNHSVGAGKTLVAVGTVMESRRMGLMKKPMIVVPNHLLAQWQDAFYSLYPQANILVADKNDFSRENRERLFAKIATGDWDAVVVAHSSFKKIGLPDQTLKSILNEQINDLTEAIEAEKSGHSRRNIVKEMEKTKARLEAKMARKADTGPKDKAVTFADLGCDTLIVDESQSFKNLYINTRLRNVAGLGNLAGSAMAFDLFVKARYLQQKQNGRGLYFATGTPLSNTIAELYSIQRYMSYDALKEKGLAGFDSWAATFGQVVTGWELDATGVGYKVNSRFSKFQNMPELINMYRTFADVITNKDLAERNQGKNLIPKVKDGKPFNLVLERSEQQAEYIGVQRQKVDSSGAPLFHPDGRPVMVWPKGSIIHRMETLPKDPRIDNPLKITNDARKAGLDFRLIEPSAPDFEGSKVNAAADNIFQTWKAWEADKGTQLVFCDLSTPKMAKSSSSTVTRLAAKSLDNEADQEEETTLSMDEILAGASKFSVYDDLKAKLMEKGIPENEIRFIHEANTDAQKARLFEEVNQGKVRVLMGSTAKMGAGTNVQRRLVALHHLDCPWRPSDLSQREGRIIRQGNMFHERDPEGFEVEILRYATKRTYDARLWQTVQGKAEGIEQFQKGDSLTRVIEDVASEAANAAEMKAAATGNELIFLQVQLASELKKLEGVYATFQRSQHQLERRIAFLEQFPEQAAKDIDRWKQEIELRNKNTTKEPYFACGGKLYGEKNRKELLFEVVRAMKTAVARPDQPQKVGKYRDFSIHVESIAGKGCQFVLEGQAGFYTPMSLTYQANSDFSIQGFIQRLENYMNKFEHNIVEVEHDRERKAAELAIAKNNQGRPFPQAVLLNALRQDNREVLRELQLTQKDPAYKSTWRPQSQAETMPHTQAASARAQGPGR